MINDDVKDAIKVFESDWSYMIGFWCLATFVICNKRRIQENVSYLYDIARFRYLWVDSKKFNTNSRTKKSFIYCSIILINCTKHEWRYFLLFDYICYPYDPICQLFLLKVLRILSRMNKENCQKCQNHAIEKISFLRKTKYNKKDSINKLT